MKKYFLLPFLLLLFIGCNVKNTDWIIINNSNTKIDFQLNSQSYSLDKNSHFFLEFSEKPEILIEDSFHVNYKLGSYYKDKDFNSITFYEQPKFKYVINNNTNFLLTLKIDNTETILIDPNSQYNYTHYKTKPNLLIYNDTIPVFFLEVVENSIIYITIM